MSDVNCPPPRDRPSGNPLSCFVHRPSMILRSLVLSVSKIETPLQKRLPLQTGFSNQARPTSGA